MARTVPGAMGASGQTTSTRVESVERGHRSRGRSVFRLRYLLVAVVLVWAGYHYLTKQLPQYHALQNQKVALTKQLQTLQAKHQQLQTQESQLQDIPYVLQYAAKRYNLILPNQVAFDIHH